MVGYSLEIHGRKHETCEDSSFIAPIFGKNGETGELYIIGDGLSGYNGLRASHFAVKTIGERIIDNIAIKGFEHSQASVIEAICNTNADLSSMSGEFRTTLDLLLVQPSGEKVLAHIGDGRVYSISGNQLRQLTIDESAGISGPSNFLGENFILGKPIEERITISKMNSRESYFLTTDGLRSRVSDVQLSKLFVNDFYDPQHILHSLSQEVYVPSSKLFELREDRLQLLYDLLGQSISDSQDKLNEVVIAYQRRKNKKLVLAIDKLFPFDDVTMIYVDCEDRVTKNLKSWHQFSTIELPGNIEVEVVKIAKDQESEARSEIDSVESYLEGIVKSVYHDGKEFVKELCIKLNKKR